MDKRMMLKTTAADGDSVQSGYSMNDSTVMRLSRLSRISEINVDLDGRYFNRYLGDGLILSTPTGSTAYSLSAGGPVVDPKLECMILTPICSHSVFTRSLVLGDDAVLRIYSDDADHSPFRAMATSRSQSRRRGANGRKGGHLRELYQTQERQLCRYTQQKNDEMEQQFPR